MRKNDIYRFNNIFHNRILIWSINSNLLFYIDLTVLYVIFHISVIFTIYKFNKPGNLAGHDYDDRYRQG